MTLVWNSSMANRRTKADGDILIVEDDAILRELIADWLEAAGYSVRKVSETKAALKALEDAPAALIISDMFMPGACGAAAIQALKRGAPSAPVIALSAYFDTGTRMTAEEALAAGAARALAKPVRRAKLLAAMSELIGSAAITTA
jgi:CheY-like chemotaxis protein